MATVLTINGTPVDFSAVDCVISGGVLYGRGEVPSIRFAVTGGALDDFPAWDNAEVLLTEGGTNIFFGDTVSHLDHWDEDCGWVREWTALGLLNRSFRVPVTDSNTLTDTINFNLTPQDGPDYIPSRAGRSVGQIVADVLEMDANAAALDARGIGAYTSAGTGATASVTISGGAVTAITVTNGGTGYTTSPTVIISGGGGGSGATATAHVTAGAVSSITVNTGGSGYNAVPIAILSRLPSATLTDLDAMPIIPPQRVTISGERILQALEAAVQVYYPNAWLDVRPDGTIRFHDPRSWPSDITLTLDGSDPRVPRPNLLRDYSGCFSRVLIRGNTQIQGITLNEQPLPGSGLADGGIEQDFAHDGLSNADAKTKWNPADWNQPGQTSGQALAVAGLTAGAVSSITITNGGYNYGSTPSVLISGNGTGATATAHLTSGVVTSITINTGGSGYTTATVSITAPGAGQSDVGTCTCPSTTTVTVTSIDPRVNWVANYWDQSLTGHQGRVLLMSDTEVGLQQRWEARIIANTSLSAGGTSTLTIDNPLPALTYNAYQIFGTGGGAGNVWRRYHITNAAIAAAVQQAFPYEVPYRPGASMAETLVSSPQATVFYSASGSPPYQQSSVGIQSIDPDAGTVTLSKPTVLVFSPDGRTLVGYNDLQFFLPVAYGILEAVYPADIAGVPQYDGTCFTVEGMEETKTVTCREWRDYGNAANMLLWAQEMHGAYCDTVIEGDVSYLGLLDTVLEPGHKANLPGDSYATGWETINIPIARVELTYHNGRSATAYTTELHLSNRRAPYSGEAFLRPSITGQQFGLGEGVAVTPMSRASAAEGVQGTREAAAANRAGAGRRTQAPSFEGIGTGGTTAEGGQAELATATRSSADELAAGADMSGLFSQE